MRAVASPGTYQGRYISFVYPGPYQPMPMDVGPGYAEVVGYSSPSTGRHIDVAVVREQLANDSGLRYRQLHPELYARDASAPTSIVLYRLSGGSERTAYITNGSIVATISITCPVEADLSLDMQTVLAGFVWRSVY